MAALVREAGLAVVRELMSNYPTGSSMPAAGRVTGGGADHCPSSATATSSSEGTSSDSASSGDGSLALINTEKKQPPVCISARHFEAALQKVRPSVALHDRQR
jgi:exo-beta-1,3-glucanase (GH17 family)